MNGIGTIPGHDAASSPRLEALRNALAGRPLVLARMLAFDALLLPEEMSVGRPPDLSTHGWSLYLLPPPPRAWLVALARPARRDDALRTMASASFDPFAEALVTDRADDALRSLSASSPGSAGGCRIESYRSADIGLTCTATGTAMAVISELAADGWTAEVDGHRETIYETDLVLRGLPLTAGTHRIRLHYATPGLRPGVAIAAISALILLLAGAREYRSRQGKQFLAP
jgi:hypothetical protein